MRAVINRVNRDVRFCYELIIRAYISVEFCRGSWEVPRDRDDAISCDNDAG